MSRFAATSSASRSLRRGARAGSALLAFAIAAALALVGTGAAHADDNPLTAAPIDATTRQGQAVSIQLQGSGPAGDQLNYSLVGGFGPVATTNGSVSMDFNSGFPPSRAIYTPNPGFSGVDSFQYQVSDNQLNNSLPATVTITVSPVSPDNHAPVATPFSLTCENPGQVQVTATGTDVDGDVLTFAIASQPSHGSVLVFADSVGPQLVYFPEDGYLGPDSYTYTANDGVLTSDPATVTIDVTPPRANSVPTSVPPHVTTAQDTPVTFTIPATDLDGDPIFFGNYQDALHGTVANSGDQFTYTPDLGYYGTDTFHYDVNDQRSTSFSYAVQVTVTPAAVPPHTPSVRAFSVVTRGEPVAVTLLGSDADGDALTYTTAAGPGHGTLSGSGADLVYTADANYIGQDSFTYQASDGQHVSTPAIVKISVLSPYDNVYPTVDVSVSADERQSGKVISPEFSTTGADRLIVAFISVNGPASSAEAAAQRVTSVQGGHLNWTLVKRANSTGGTAEVWQAHATSLISAATVTAKFAKSGFDGSITVAAFANTPGAVGDAAAAAGKRGAPSATTVTAPESGSPVQIWAVGHDWSRATTPVPLLDQALVHSYSGRQVDGTFWTERTNFSYGSGDVTAGLSSPTTDRWQLVAVAIPGLPSAASYPGIPQ